MKRILLVPMALCGIVVTAQQTVAGRVTDETTGAPVTGAAVTVNGSGTAALTDRKGDFRLTATAGSIVLQVSHPEYETRSLSADLPLRSPLQMTLAPRARDIEEVSISTGYQKIPKERATGSFTTVSAKALEQQVSTGILERLESIAGGIMVDRGTSSAKTQIMVRGLSTIRGPKSPLIVVDNFPYEGDISNINPNFVESITVLKDAAAASIWGARAANGVIVITTKGSKFDKPLRIDFSVNTSFTDKPDLGYIRQMSSADFIELEQELFSRGFYNSDLNSTGRTVVSPVVDLLDKEKKGLVSHDAVARQLEKWRGVDMRDQYSRYMYQAAVRQQYALNLSGGSRKVAWISSLGYDENESNLAERYRRFNMQLRNRWQPFEKLSLSAGIYMTDAAGKSGRSGYGSIAMKGNNAVPYMQFADGSGNPLAVFTGLNQNYKDQTGAGKLLDWNYYPLTDWRHAVSTSRTAEVLLDASVNYKILNGLEADAKYLYRRNTGQSETLYDEDSYFARNYVNRFAQFKPDGSVDFIVPRGGILGRSHTLTDVHNLRGQLNYNRQWQRHSVSALAGGEMRESAWQYTGNRFYGYNSRNQTGGAVDYTRKYPTLPNGSAFIDDLNSMGSTNQRFVSLFANAAYTYADRYTLSGSARRDASNLFGLKANDLWNPFWSAGVAWNVSREGFYNAAWLPQLKLRASYGFNGNIDPAMVAVTTIAFQPSNSPYTGTKMAQFNNYYNPNLRWETIRMFNAGVDFASHNNRIAGSVEYFEKKGENLFGQAPMDYTTGITGLLWNVAGMRGTGVDVELRTLNTTGALRWNSVLNFSSYRDKVTKYHLSNTTARQFVLSTVPISGVEGLPVYSVFGYRWAGLDPQTGDPRGYLNGEVSKDYTKITGVGTDVKDLRYFGSAIPTVYGSFTNNFSYGSFDLDVGISYKFGYWFRKRSVNYTNLYRDWSGHSDYALRWQKPGDEAFTHVPSNNYKADSNRDAFYAGSEILVEKGDHIRLQYINLGYRLTGLLPAGHAIKDLRLSFNVGNAGLLWKANKSGTDPDLNLGMNTPKTAATYSLGLRTQF